MHDSHADAWWAVTMFGLVIVALVFALTLYDLRQSSTPRPSGEAARDASAGGSDAN